MRSISSASEALALFGQISALQESLKGYIQSLNDTPEEDVACEKGPEAPKAAKPTKMAAKIVKEVVAQSDMTAVTKAQKGVIDTARKPPLVSAMAIVMGKDTINAGEILERLKERGWLPESGNPKQYIAVMLSTNATAEDGKDVFHRVDRGLYKVKNAKKYAGFANYATSLEKAVKVVDVAVAAKKERALSTEEALSELGITPDGVGEPPWGTTEE